MWCPDNIKSKSSAAQDNAFGSSHREEDVYTNEEIFSNFHRWSDSAVLLLLYQKQFIKVLLDAEFTRNSNRDSTISSNPPSINAYISGMFQLCFEIITQHIATVQILNTNHNLCGWINKYGKNENEVFASIAATSTSNAFDINSFIQIVKSNIILNDLATKTLQ